MKNVFFVKNHNLGGFITKIINLLKNTFKDPITPVKIFIVFRRDSLLLIAERILINITKLFIIKKDKIKNLPLEKTVKKKRKFMIMKEWTFLLKFYLKKKEMKSNLMKN